MPDLDFLLGSPSTVHLSAQDLIPTVGPEMAPENLLSLVLGLVVLVILVISFYAGVTWEATQTECRRDAVPPNQEIAPILKEIHL